MVAVAAGCRKALDYFSAFLHKRVQKTLLTIECSLIVGVVKVVKDLWEKLWLNFPGLTHSRSESTGEKKV